MLDLRLHAPGTGAVGAAVMEAVMGDSTPELLAHARRPAIMTYYSPVMEQVHKALQLPWYLLGWRHEAEVLKVDLMEGIEFARGWRSIPATARIELSSDTKLQVYKATLVFTAQFRGLRYVVEKDIVLDCADRRRRYIMYNYRIISFVVCTTIFWIAELVSALVGWMVLSYLMFPSKDERGPLSTRKIQADDDESMVKTEPGEDEGDETEELSDTERSFPTYSRQPPLRYSSTKVKKEEEEPESELAEVPPAGAEADDEDEDAEAVATEAARLRGLHSDSGLGTSMESSAPRRESGSIRRRRSGLGSEERRED